MNNRLLVALFLSLFISACAQDSDAPAEAAAAAEAAVAKAEEMAAVAAGELTGDPTKGKRFYIFCQACHTLNAGGMNKVGPNLHGIVGAPAAQVEGFVYSEALSNSGITWDEEMLDKWITRPAEAVPGTTMVFAGISDPQQRADLIAYLKSASAE